LRGACDGTMKRKKRVVMIVANMIIRCEIRSCTIRTKHLDSRHEIYALSRVQTRCEAPSLVPALQASRSGSTRAVSQVTLSESRKYNKQLTRTISLQVSIVQLHLYRPRPTHAKDGLICGGLGLASLRICGSTGGWTSHFGILRSEG
jgi:hypothetical protein